MNKQELIQALEEIGIDSAPRLVSVYYGYADERSVKPPETLSEFMAWVIWRANRYAQTVASADTPVKAGKAAYDAAANFQRIYQLSLAGVVPAPQATFMVSK